MNNKITNNNQLIKIMEYIKKKDLKDGDVFVAQLSHNHFMNKMGTGYNLHLKTDDTIRVKVLYKGGGFSYDNMRLATPEEKHWLEECIKADKFIEYDEAMKSFIPEYVECIQQLTGSAYKLGIIYKTNTSGLINGGMGYYQLNKNRFKPSTKEAYDAQFIVKEPEFALPEKWCLRITNENLNFCKSLENNELHYKKNYNYCVNGYYSAIKSDSGNYGFSGIPQGFVQITFEQFKKYVLKEEIMEEVKVVEPLPQFKVIESVETITKVENNEGNQFFIGDVVKTEAGLHFKIIGFKYDENKTKILAIATDNYPEVVKDINDIEHYIEPKVEETLLEKAKRLYSIGTRYISEPNDVYFNRIQSSTAIFEVRNQGIFCKNNSSWFFYKNKWEEIINE
jgi:hypothetical protein